MNYSELSQNQLRVSVDLRQTYEAYREARRNTDRCAGGLGWKSVGGREYLIKVLNRRGGTRAWGRERLRRKRFMRTLWRGKHAPRRGRRAWLHRLRNSPAWPGG